MELLYDHKERVVGFRAVDANTEDAFAVTPVSKGANTFVVSGKSFVRHMGLGAWVRTGKRTCPNAR